MVAPCSSSPASCCTHVLAGQLPRRHVRLAHLLHQRRAHVVAPAAHGALHVVLGHAVGPHPHRGQRRHHGDRHEARLDRLGQALPRQVGAPRHPAGGRRAAVHRHRRAEEVELGRPGVGHVGHPVHHADHPVGAERAGLLEHAAVGRVVALGPGVLHPGLLEVLPPGAVLVGDEAVRAAVGLRVRARGLLTADVGRHAAHGARARPVPTPLHDAEALHQRHRLQAEVEAGGEVGHAQARGERGGLQAADGRLGQVAVRAARRPAVVTASGGGLARARARPPSLISCRAR